MNYRIILVFHHTIIVKKKGVSNESDLKQVKSDISEYKI